MIHHKKTRRWLAEERKCERSTFEKKGADFFAWWTKIEIELKVDLVFFCGMQKIFSFLTTYYYTCMHHSKQQKTKYVPIYEM